MRALWFVTGLSLCVFLAGIVPRLAQRIAQEEPAAVQTEQLLRKTAWDVVRKLEARYGPLPLAQWPVESRVLYEAGKRVLAEFGDLPSARGPASHWRTRSY
jgi:hypothetical protein